MTSTGNNDSKIRLWLDDERPMRMPFNLHVKTRDAAIEVLKGGNVIEIAFDNDLGPVEAGEGNEVARWIEEQAFLNQIAPMLWSRHSGNVSRWKEIDAAMKNADPFWLGHGHVLPVREKSPAKTAD